MSTNNREEILNTLHKKGIVLSEEKEKTGANSQVTKLINTKTKEIYALKIYGGFTHYEKMTRKSREQIFLRYCSQLNIQVVPKIYERYWQNHEAWSIIEWINGKEIKELNNEDLKGIAEFIKNLNNRKETARAKNLPIAKEGILNHQNLTHQIHSRFEEAKIWRTQESFSKRFKLWLNKELMPVTKKRIQEYNKKRDNENWLRQNISPIVSPSDVGIHNMLRGEKNLYFIDFEYAGLDDISKTIADWTLQPEKVLSIEQEQILKEEITACDMIAHEDKYWLERLEDIKPLIHSKWCYIIARQINKAGSQEIRESYEEKAVKYYESFCTRNLK